MRPPDVNAALRRLEALALVELLPELPLYPSPEYRVYAAARSWFSEIGDALDYTDFLTAVAIVYGWAAEPLAFRDLGDERNEALVDVLARVAGRELVERADLRLVREAFGGDVAAASRLLHFLGPDDYAFWGPAEFAYLAGRPARPGDVEQLEVYAFYCERLRELAASVQAVQVARRVREVSPEVGRMRALQVVMGLAGERGLAVG